MKTNDLLWRDEDKIIFELQHTLSKDTLPIWYEILEEYFAGFDPFFDIR